MTQLEQRMMHLVAAACSKYIGENNTIDWEQRKYEAAKDYAIGLMTSQWYDGTEQQAIERGIEFAENLIEKLK